MEGLLWAAVQPDRGLLRSITLLQWNYSTEQVGIKARPPLITLVIDISKHES